MTQPDEAAIPDGPQKAHGDALEEVVDPTTASTDESAEDDQED